MFEALCFVLGFIFGVSSCWYYYNRVHKLLLELDGKYNRLVTLISEWQKKI